MSYTVLADTCVAKLHIDKRELQGLGQAIPLVSRSHFFLRPDSVAILHHSVLNLTGDERQSEDNAQGRQLFLAEKMNGKISLLKGFYGGKTRDLTI